MFALHHDAGAKNEREEKFVFFEQRSANVRVEIVSKMFLEIFQTTRDDFRFQTERKKQKKIMKTTKVRRTNLSLIELM